MTAMNNTINILQPYLKKIESVYGQVLHFDDNKNKKYGYAVGAGGIIIAVSKKDGSLTILVFEKMYLEDTRGYLTYHGSPDTTGVFAYTTAEEAKEILENLCNILLETPATDIDAKTVKQKIMKAEFACYRKHHPISETAMQSMKHDAERAEQNMLLKKG